MKKKKREVAKNCFFLQHNWRLYGKQICHNYVEEFNLRFFLIFDLTLRLSLCGRLIKKNEKSR